MMLSMRTKTRGCLLAAIACLCGCEHDLVLGEPLEQPPARDLGFAGDDGPADDGSPDNGRLDSGLPDAGRMDDGTTRDDMGEREEDMEMGSHAPVMFEPAQVGITFTRGLSTYDSIVSLMLTDVDGRLGCLAVEDPGVFPSEDGAQLWSVFAHRRQTSRALFSDGECIEAEILLVESDFCVRAFDAYADGEFGENFHDCALFRQWRGRDVLPYRLARTGRLLFTTKPDAPGVCRVEVELLFPEQAPLEYTFEGQVDPEAITQCFSR